jgi:hypothetical protein
MITAQEYLSLCSGERISVLATGKQKRPGANYVGSDCWRASSSLLPERFAMRTTRQTPKPERRAGVEHVTGGPGNQPEGDDRLRSSRAREKNGGLDR